ncbi:MAG: hypothetical protein PHW02_05405 [bacterium]|nr:hypothetical protein [bacterium]
MVKRVILFLLIISFFSIFSSRDVNYDDVIYFDNGKYVSQNGLQSFLERDWPFHGTTVKITEGTHTVAPILFYSVLFDAGFSKTLIHLIIYIMYAGMLFPLESVFSRLKAKHPLGLAFLFLASPAISVYANSFMADIPAFSAVILSIYFLTKSFDSRTIAYALLFILTALVSVLFSYTSFLVFPLVFIAFDECRKRRNLMIISISFLIALVFISIMNFYGLAPSLIRSVKWFGSEKLFNHHKTLEKILALFVWTGLFALPKIFQKTKSNIPANLLILASAFIISMFYFGSLQNNISKAILFILVFSGINCAVVLFKENHSLKKTLLTAGFGIASALFFPMVIGRYLLFFFFLVFILLYREEKLKSLIFFITLSAGLSSVLLTSDMLHSKSYSNLDFTLPKQDGSISFSAKRRFVIGEWGYRHYAEHANAEPVNLENIMMSDRDILFAPLLENMSDISKLAENLNLVRTDSVFDFPIKLLSKESGSGYYTSMYGILPFSFSKEYSVKNFVYEYSETPNANLLKYADRVAFWNGEIVIPSHTADTVKLYLKEDEGFRVVFFPDKVVRKSDGIYVTVQSFGSDGNPTKTEFSAGVKEMNSFKADRDGGYTLTFSSKENSDFDWFGISLR